MALDVVAGTIAGVAGITACQPMDTVKVRLQTQLRSARVRYQGPIHCARTILKMEGVMAFYKGMVAPVVSNAPINAIVFGAERSFMRQLRKYDFDPVMQHMVAGSAAGFMQSFIAAPAELIKVRLQADRSGDKPLYTGNRDCAKHLPAFGLYFWTYDVCKMWFQRREAARLGVPVEACPMLPSWQLMMSGGIAGTVSWALLHPVDVIKSCVQAMPDSIPAERRTVTAVAKAGYAREGVSFFFRGYAATLTRAFPNSAVTFLVYEYILHQSDHLLSWWEADDHRDEPHGIA